MAPPVIVFSIWALTRPVGGLALCDPVSRLGSRAPTLACGAPSRAADRGAGGGGGGARRHGAGGVAARPGVRGGVEAGRRCDGGDAGTPLAGPRRPAWLLLPLREGGESGRGSPPPRP